MAAHLVVRFAVPLRLPSPFGSLELPFEPDELYRVPTEDGSTIALGRHRPKGERRWAQPVVLAHGMGANRYNFDFDARYSLARYLARRGFDAWVLELRGRGLASRPHAATFDEQAQHDVGAALKTVLSTGASDVLWVGHSKGGLVAYAHLARNPQAPVRAIVALGTPLRFSGHRGVGRFLEWVRPFLQLEVIPLRLATRVVAPIGLPPGPIAPYLANAENMEPRVVRQAIHNVSADVLGGVARQFARWVRDDVFDGDDGFDYRAGMRAIRAPLLLFAGARDLLAPPDSVGAALEYTGGPGELVTLGRAHGFRADYGHGDLVLGRHAPDEVFPRIADFLERHAQPA